MECFWGKGENTHIQNKTVGITAGAQPTQLEVKTYFKKILTLPVSCQYSELSIFRF
jgi:hypothetical protein